VDEVMNPTLLNRVHAGDCLELASLLPPSCVDVVVTSPPYWGQRVSGGVGVEEDPRYYLVALVERFEVLKRVMKPKGLLWVNVGDAYNTPVNWRTADRRWSTLGPDGRGLSPANSAYVKPRHKRRAFVTTDVPWLRYGNLLALPYRLILALCDHGFLFRGEVIWRKRNPLPEGRCRRPHRAHESIYLFTLREDHHFRVTPPVKSVWEFPNEQPVGFEHFSRFPLELPRRCISAYGKTGEDVTVLDPFSGSATTCLAALMLGCSYIGFEIDPDLVSKSNTMLEQAQRGKLPQRPLKPCYEQADCPLFAS
jgi:DNA modification methylase